MRIDAHQHFWNYVPARDAWITPEMSAIRRDFLPGDLAGELRAHSIDGTIAVQVDTSEEENRFLLELAERFPFIRGVVGWVDLTRPDIAERLEDLRRFPRLCGFRHIVQNEADDNFMLRADFGRGIAALSRFGFRYDILIYPRQLPAAVALARAHPGQPFVLNHIAKPEIRAGKTEPWARHIRELGACPNVSAKLSGLITEAHWTAWRAEDFKKYLDVVFEAFGTERLMFGSDWPVCLVAGSYSRVVDLLWSYLDGFRAEEKTAIFGGNAARFYGVGAPGT